MYLRTLVEIFSDTSDMGMLRILAIGVFLIGIVCLASKSLLGSVGSTVKKMVPTVSGSKPKRKNKKNNQDNPENTDTDTVNETSAPADGVEVSS